MDNEIRLIDANALTLEIQEDLDLETTDGEPDSKERLIAIGLKIALKEVRKAPTVVPQPGGDTWISVKDHLPTEDGGYMVWHHGGYDICEFNTDSQTFGNTVEEYDEVYSKLRVWDDYLDKWVTHWQPLPKQPKGE